MNRCLLVGCLSLLCTAAPSIAYAQEPPGGAAKPERAYRHQWALIIGIDYRKADYEKIGDRPKVSELSNPEKDARDFSELLQKHYGYKKEHILMLLGRKATYDEFSKNLGTRFVCHPDNVGPDDSVLVYYAGHGDRLEDSSHKDRGYVIPADVEYYLDRPLDNKLLHFHKDIVARLAKSPARHKLLILDCCHSGEIFNTPLPAFNISDDRATLSAFKDTAVQAIASCRATQEAGDGRLGTNSPFMAALRRALTTVPARSAEAEKFLPVTRLFLGMTPDFQYLPRNQAPSLRSLAGEDGEFHFFPRGSFDAYRGTDADKRLMQAMVPGEHGNWWFDEMPWMIPSLRQDIVGELEVARTTSVTHHIHAKALRECAQAVLNKYKQTKSPLQEMRYRHLQELIKAQGDTEYPALLATIAKELAEHDKLLQASDLHFLAVIDHRLNDKKTAASYARALAAYAKARSDKQPSIMEALCRSDLGHYLIEIQADKEAGIRELDRAYKLVQIEFGVGKESPLDVSPFCIFLRCRKADAWQRLKVWGEANNDLDVALQLARDLDKKHPLTAFVHRRRAWAYMEQWRFAGAIDEFQLSNAILEGKTDLVSRVAELHNRHGLAMAKRFQGEPIAAVQSYRRLVNDIAAEFRVQAASQHEDFAARDVRSLLAERFVNTHERLVDCNLFGPPGVRDLAEAVEDVRRGLRGCSSLPLHRRSVARANLLFKQAIALGLPSPIQDVELAKEYRDAAQKLYEESGKPVELAYQQALTAPLVELFATNGKGYEPEKRRAKLACLRQAIQALEADLALNANRDHLEFLMFASKILLEEGLDADQRFLLLQDAERLQGLARRALGKDTSLYLRPYYEAVMRARLQLNPRHVKELLEVQWEATMGKRYDVPVTSQPTLALFAMEGKSYLFLDLPRSAGKVFSLEGDIALTELQEAATSAKAKIALPREVQRELERWTKANPNGELAQLRLHWRDPVRGLGVARQAKADSGPAGVCPFEAPPRWRLAEPPTSPIALNRIGKGDDVKNPE